MINIDKIKALLTALDLNLTYETKFEENVSRIYIYLHSNGKTIGECCFVGKNGNFSLKRIDIYEECDRKNGYGSILLYAALSYMYANQGNECEIEAFPINFSFYVKNGFYDFSPDEDSWYQLSVDEKKQILYKANGENEGEDIFFNRDEDIVDMVFKFKNFNAINILNQNIDELNKRYRDEISFEQLANPVLNLYGADSKQRTAAKIYLRSNFRFLNGLPNNDDVKDLFEETLKKYMPTYRS